MAGNIFAAGMDAFDRSYDRTNVMRQDRARMQAGRSLASWDRTGAAQALGQAGDIGGVRQLQSDQMQVDDRGRAEEEAATKRRYDALVKVSQGLKTVPPGQRMKALQGVAPVFQSVGVDPSMFAGLTEEQLSDQALDVFSGEVEKAYSQVFHNPEQGIYGVKKDGRVDTLQAFPKKPLVVPASSNVYMPEDPPVPAIAPSQPAGGEGMDQISGGSGSDRLSGGDQQIPGYRLMQRAAVKPTKAAQGPAQWRTMPESESAQYGPGKFQLNTRTGEVKPISSTGREPTVDAKKTTAFAYRTLRANDRMNALADKGIFKPTSPTESLLQMDKSGSLRVFARTPEDRQFIQAAKEWLAPVLRKDTGAAVTDGELATYMDIFIPRFEDDQATLQQKAEARQDTMIALVREAGPLYDQTFGRRQFQSKYQAPAKGKGQRGKTQGDGWKVIP